MSRIPRDKNPDSTLALALDGSAFILKRSRRYGSNVFRTRLMLQSFLCMTGEEAARVFYDSERFMRRGAAPRRVKATLFGFGGVQGLDDAAHQHRKAMFLSLMAPQGIQRLSELAEEQWRAYAARWETADRVVLHGQVRELLCRTVCAWTGVPLDESDVERRTNDLGELIDSPAAVGPKHWEGRLARWRAERWIGSLVEQVRAGTLSVAEGSALHAVATHRDLGGELLDTRVAAVEVLNVLRPTVAVARYVTFTAVALHEHPEYRQSIRTGEDDLLEPFVQEVRRFYPFFPFVGAKVRRDFAWRGYRFPEGTKVLLDLYGTNHDPRSWDRPGEFRPERFRSWDGNPFDFIPQGGGDHLLNHRCPGEWITIELMKEALRFLTRSIEYDVPEQDLQISLRKIPALPASGFVMRNVRRTGPGSIARLTPRSRQQGSH